MKTKTIIGVLLIVCGLGLYIYYDQYIQPEREASKLLVEAKMIYERGNREAVNDAINLFTKIIARYPETEMVGEAYYYIGQCYEKLGLKRLAYLKYVYLLKNNREQLSDSLQRDLIVRVAHINVLKKNSEEAIHQMYALLNSSMNKEFRSRVYSELGHTYLKTGEYSRARRMFEIALREHGSNEDAILGRARSLKHLGQESEAYDNYDYFLKYYGEISQYTDDVKDSYRNQAYQSGLHAFRKGQYWKGIGFFKRVLTHFPGHKRSENALYWTGECYFALKKFDRAIGYFNRTLTNNFYHKDQDAQIKKGYSYFMSKRFDLAAREFQKYIRYYPRGKYVAVAREWNKISTKELRYRIQRSSPSSDEKEEETLPEEEKVDDSLDDELGLQEDEEVSATDQGIYKRIERVNVAEL